MLITMVRLVDMCNRYKSHLVIIPEDQEMLDLVNGALLVLNTRSICVENIAGGQPNVFNALNSDQKWKKSYLNKYDKAILLLLIDFDCKFDDRYKEFLTLIQPNFHDRIFLLGVDHKETDDLKTFFISSMVTILTMPPRV